MDISYNPDSTMSALFVWNGMTYKFTNAVKISSVEIPILKTPLYYYGVHWNQKSGHLLYTPGGERVNIKDEHDLKESMGVIKDFVFERKTFDYPVLEFFSTAKRCPQRKLPNTNEPIKSDGESHLYHVNDWTLLAFWDTSGDGRGSSHSNFFTQGEWDFDQMCMISRHEYPLIWKRIDTHRFKVVLIPQ